MLSILSIASMMSLTSPLASANEILEGVAKNKKGDVVYLETHTITTDQDGLNRLIKVEYTTPKGEKFATMTSDFTKSKTVPETVFEDQRFKSKVTISIVADKVEFEEFKDGNSVAKKSVPYQKNMVASQGFDNFIKINFADFGKKPLDFKFGVIADKDFYSLTGYRKPASQEAEAHFGIKASTWFLNLFAGELHVVYDAQNKKLKTFSGLSNIPTDAGKSQDVTISYTWKTPK